MSEVGIPGKAWHIPTRWGLLTSLSLALAFALSRFQLPAVMLIGPMLVAIGMASRGLILRVPPLVVHFSQAIIGCLMASSLRPELAPSLWHNGWIFATVTVLVIGASSAMGWLQARLHLIPGTTAIWGSTPGAATAMIVMAEAYGADVRLVASMQYLRVVVVGLVASLVAKYFMGPIPEVSLDWATQSALWLPVTSLPDLAATIALALFGVGAARIFKLPAGAMLIPMILGAILPHTGLMQLALPPWLLAPCYVVVAWSIGMRFTPAIMRHVARMLPAVMASIFLLVALCGGIAAGLVAAAGVDPLTAYLAASPGGADTVAVIAATSHNHVDVPFIMAMQMLRFLVVLALGPRLARWVAERV